MKAEEGGQLTQGEERRNRRKGCREAQEPWEQWPRAASALSGPKSGSDSDAWTGRSWTHHCVPGSPPHAVITTLRASRSYVRVTGGETEAQGK